MAILITGGSGFIGSNFIKHIDQLDDSQVLINLDKLTYASRVKNLQDVSRGEKYIFVHGDITDKQIVSETLSFYKPWAVVHFAAESHVDNSIGDPSTFINTNVFGTYNLLECVREFLLDQNACEKERFRFIHVSTDEVYGQLEQSELKKKETDLYAPRNPYSASKAAADHLVNSYFSTYDLNSIIIRSCNNYGPFQHPEKLIPKVIMKALNNEPIPIYGDGKQKREWIYVGDHCDAIYNVLYNGSPGETYNVSSNVEIENIQLVNILCKMLDSKVPVCNYTYKNLITFVEDRPGHDRRYAMNCEKIGSELGWSSKSDFEEMLSHTIGWYLMNSEKTESRIELK
ncbi:MAG: dTDP-glucose 4,6-dehydratase [Rhodospirillaceae bacterium]|nr:dTDP-glucose 4,6-dehydratase [Rhodospirillaceae bacterium]|tara:strand:+ start:9766 stop:10794 length:1029 start_codon:yes stop_codon:yes gene_type:complete